MTIETPYSLFKPRSVVSSEPDYGFWREKEFWSLSEAVKIICGRDPIQKYPSPQIYNKKSKVIEIIDIAFEAVKAGELQTLRNALIPIHILLEPKCFLHWAVSRGLTIPPELQDISGIVSTNESLHVDPYSNHRYWGTIYHWTWRGCLAYTKLGQR